MNFKALVTAALVIGTSSAAFAGPWTSSVEVRDHRAPVVAVREPARTEIRDHRSNQPVRWEQPVRVHTPVYEPVYQPAPISNGFLTVGSFNYAFDGTKNVDLGCDGRLVNDLRIYSADGNSEIYNVVVRFADGQSQTYSWNHIFDAASDGQAGPFLNMGIGGRVVKSVQIDGRNASASRMSVQIA